MEKQPIITDKAIRILNDLIILQNIRLQSQVYLLLSFQDDRFPRGTLILV